MTPPEQAQRSAEVRQRREDVAYAKRLGARETAFAFMEAELQAMLAEEAELDFVPHPLPQSRAQALWLRKRAGVLGGNCEPLRQEFLVDGFDWRPRS